MNTKFDEKEEKKNNFDKSPRSIFTANCTSSFIRPDPMATNDNTQQQTQIAINNNKKKTNTSNDRIVVS